MRGFRISNLFSNITYLAMVMVNQSLYIYMYMYPGHVYMYMHGTHNILYIILMLVCI